MPESVSVPVHIDGEKVAAAIAEQHLPALDLDPIAARATIDRFLDRDTIEGFTVVAETRETAGPDDQWSRPEPTGRLSLIVTLRRGKADA